MSTTWFTADLHFGHERIVELSHRPFASTDEHDKALIDNWNDRVAEGDIVWVLGDLAVEGSYKKAIGYTRWLKGRKRLVAGNHDQCWMGKSSALRYLPEYALGYRHAGWTTPLNIKHLREWGHDKGCMGYEDCYCVFPQAGFEVVTPWARAKIGQHKVLLSHFPYVGDHTEEDRYPQYRLPIGPTPLLHGHTHSPDRLGPVNLPPQIHVGVDAWDYRPVASYELEPLLERSTEQSGGTR